jgi:hypothetical protein
MIHLAGPVGAQGRGNDEGLAKQSSVALMEGAPGVMVCLNADGLIARVHAWADRPDGWRRGELTGQPVTAREWMAAMAGCAQVGGIRVQDLGG